jgi:hypothetical protein
VNRTEIRGGSIAWKRRWSPCPDPTGRLRPRWLVLGVPFLLLAVILTLLVLSRPQDGVALVSGEPTVPTLPSITVPPIPEPVDPSTLEDGWYLVVYTQVSAMEDALLLQAARELALEARAVGYGDAKIVHNQGTEGECTDGGGCVIGTPAIGYDVLLKGPYDVPNWFDNDADMDAMIAWHQTTLGREREEAASRGLTIAPALHMFTFPDE